MNCAYDNSSPLAARRINSLLNISIDLKRAFFLNHVKDLVIISFLTVS